MLMARPADDSQSTFGSTKETIRPPPVAGGAASVGVASAVRTGRVFDRTTPATRKLLLYNYQLKV